MAGNAESAGLPLSPKTDRARLAHPDDAPFVSAAEMSAGADGRLNERKGSRG